MPTALTCLLAAITLLGGQAAAQEITLGDEISPIEISVGRSIPMTTRTPIERVSVASPEVADVVVVAERELVVNAIGPGITDVIVWLTNGRKFHYRVNVHSPTDRKQVLLQVRIGEADRDLLRELGFSFLWQDQHSRVGTNQFVFDPFDDETGEILVEDRNQFATVLSAGEVENLLALLDINEQSGRFRILAEPNLIAANGEEASFLAGGELPIPIAQATGTGGGTQVTIQWREFGVRLTFTPEILSEELVKLKIVPEISNLDFGNAIEVSGFLVPALRTRRAGTTLDLRQGQTLAIAGLLNFQEESVNVGVPVLKDIPILGLLFSSQRMEQSETELLFLVTPTIVDPMAAPLPPPMPGEQPGGDSEEDSR
jgi:Flp pilus assembly secretin CpaC